MKRKFLNLNIRNKLMLSFILLISVPLLIVAFQSYYVASSVIERKTRQYSHDILFQTAKNLEVRLEKIEDISFNIVFDTEIQRAVAIKSPELMDSIDFLSLQARCENIIVSQVLYHDEINAIYLIAYNGLFYELDKTKQKYGLMEEYIYKIEEGQGGSVWIGALPNKEVVVMSRIINDIRTQLPVGYLLLYIDANYLQELINATYSVENGVIQIIDQNGYIVVDSNSYNIGSKWSLHETVNSLNYSFEKKEIGGIDQYIAVSEPMKNGWRLVTRVPVSVYQSEIYALRNTILTLVLILLLLAIVLAAGISNTISNPIMRLSKTMTKLGKGELDERSNIESQDEIGKLSDTFNQMADNIEELIKKVTKEQLMKREAELKSLQMQINPHFLYNTLETINWMARNAGNNEIGIMVKSLGDLMRSTINGKDYVLLNEEIDSLKSYLQIQKCRYANKFNVVFLVQEGVKCLFVPKLIIQPIVENAIYHGIEPSFEHGTITIEIKEIETMLEITVSDNGVGMTQEMLEEIIDINKKHKKKDSYSIGIQNCIKRIKTLFGDPYGISINSELGEGTCVEILLPIIRTMNEKQSGVMSRGEFKDF